MCNPGTLLGSYLVGGWALDTLYNRKKVKQEQKSNLNTIETAINKQRETNKLANSNQTTQELKSIEQRQGSKNTAKERIPLNQGVSSINVMPSVGLNLGGY